MAWLLGGGSSTMGLLATIVVSQFFTVAMMRHIAAFIVWCNFGAISCSLAPALVAEFLNLVRVSYDSSSLVFSVSCLLQSCHLHIYMHIDVALRYFSYDWKPRISSTLCHTSTT